MTFGEKLCKLRKEKGLSQEMLAERLNTTRQAVSKWENNQGYPEMEKLLSISDIFQVTLDYLAKDETGQPEHTDDEARGIYVSREMAEGFLSFQRDKRLKIGAAAGLLIGGTALSFFELQNATLWYSVLAIIAVLILITAKPTDGTYRQMWRERLYFDNDIRKKILSEYDKRKKWYDLFAFLGAAFILTGLFLLPTVMPDSSYSVGIGTIMVGFGTSLRIYMNGISRAYRVLIGRKRDSKNRRGRQGAAA